MKHSNEISFIPALVVIVLMIIGAVMAIVLGPPDNYAKDNLAFEEDFYSSFNHSFSGIVTSYREYNRSGNHGGAIGKIKIDVKSSDIDLYDPRDSSDVYFTVFNQHKGVVLMNVTRMEPIVDYVRGDADVRIGDSLVFDGIKDEFFLYRNNVITYHVRRTEINRIPELRLTIENL